MLHQVGAKGFKHFLAAGKVQGDIPLQGIDGVRPHRHKAADRDQVADINYRLMAGRGSFAAPGEPGPPRKGETRWA